MYNSRPDYSKVGETSEKLALIPRILRHNIIFDMAELFHGRPGSPPCALKIKALKRLDRMLQKTAVIVFVIWGLHVAKVRTQIATRRHGVFGTNFYL